MTDASLNSDILESFSFVDLCKTELFEIKI